MSKNESLGRNNESVENGAVQTLKSSLSENLGKMPEKEQKLVKEIMTTMSVVRESFINNMEDGYDGLDLLDAGNYKSINALLDTVQTKMRLINSNKNIYNLFSTEFQNFRSNILNRDLKNKNKVLLNDLKSLDKITLMFTSTVALDATRQNIKPKEVKKEDVVETKNPKVEAKKESVDFDKKMSLFNDRLRNGLRSSINVNADSINRGENMKHLYSSDVKGDQILLKTALTVVASDQEAFNSKNDLQFLLNNVDKITGSIVPYIIAAYQDITDLKIDGKFGKNTFNALKKDAGVKLFNKNGKEITSYIETAKEKRRVKRKKRVNPIDKAKGAVAGSVEQSKEWIQTDAEYNEKMYEFLQKEVFKMNTSELADLKGLIIERAVHHGSKMEEFVAAIEPSQVQKDKMVYALESGKQNFQTVALIEALTGRDLQDEAYAKDINSKLDKFDSMNDTDKQALKDLVLERYRNVGYVPMFHALVDGEGTVEQVLKVLKHGEQTETSGRLIKFLEGPSLVQKVENLYTNAFYDLQDAYAKRQKEMKDEADLTGGNGHAGPGGPTR